ncbi:MAG: bacillithiol biosynthesis cysteine-adding enzyme BshC [Acidobacteriia bacterium]|nr:bacillithiol biosynthesis cysteine-adding enzyme BshC [Terriglobia bacterium]
MDCHCIPYTRVPHSSKLLQDYLYHFDRVAGYYTGAPFEPASYQSLAGKLRGFLPERKSLLEILKRQNRAFGCGEATFLNIDRLGDPGAFAVVTGQQVGLFSGPVFTLYKALTAVRLAQSLSEQGLPTVPVFWLASEDHDLDEVAQTTVLDEEYGSVVLSDSGERPSPRSPVGLVKLTEGIAATLDRLETALPPGDARDALLQDLRQCYQPGAGWGAAFGRLMARLFKPWGVVLVDPLDADIQRLGARAYELALTQSARLRALLQERSAALVRAGYHAQVHVADHSTLLFVNREGNRVPLDERSGKFFVDGGEEVKGEALKADAAQQPFRFSTNVLLRPILQDTLLPTLAYVAGPSELAYLAQAQALYESFGRPMPVVFPRAGFTLVDRRTQRLLEKYQISVEDVWQGEEHLGRKIAAAGLVEGWSERFDQSERELAALLEGLRKDIETLDPTLLDTLKHAEEKMKYQLEKVRGKLSRAALQRSDLLARHEQSLRRFLMPGKDLQERQVSGVYFLGRAGPELLERIHAQIQVRSSDHQVLVY